MEYISISHWGLFEAHDPVVERVRDKFRQRSHAGLAKYGVGLDRPDKDTKRIYIDGCTFIGCLFDDISILDPDGTNVLDVFVEEHMNAR